MKKLFTIGEVSKIKDITIKALRYYHKVGILIPKYTDESTGYRYYSIEQFINIDIIKGCRVLGTSISDLQDIFKECDTEKLMEFLLLKRKEAEDTIKRMNEIIGNIDSLNESVRYSNEILNNKEISKQYIEERLIVVTPCNKLGNLDELIYYSNLEKIIQEQNIKTTMERGIIYDVDTSWNVSNAFVFSLIEGNKLNESDNIKVLPSGTYLTINYTKEDEEIQRKKLNNYIKNNNLEIKTVVEVDLINDIFNTESYSCQTQVRIE